MHNDRQEEAPQLRLVKDEPLPIFESLMSAHSNQGNGVPTPGAEDYNELAVMFSDVTSALKTVSEGSALGHFPFSQRRRLVTELWRAGYRKVEEEVEEGG